MSLGKDLASIRKEQNLTLEDIQHENKMSLDTLKSIEDGSIFDQDESQITYIRSFVRSYAKALKIPEENIVAALDAVEVGIYHKGILMGETLDMEPVPELPEEKPKETVAQDPVPAPTKKAENAKQAPEVDQINWADMGRKFSPGTRNPRLWMLGSLIVIIILIVSIAWIYRDNIGNLLSSEEVASEQVDDQQNDTSNMINAVDSTENETEATPEPNEPNIAASPAESSQNTVMPDTLTVTVYAANGQLEPVRVISDFNWKTNPFWMEQGEAYSFDFRDTLLVRGQYSRFLLLYNGHLIENPRMNYFSDEFDAILVSRAILSDDRYQEAAPDEFPLEVGPPDTIEYKIRF
ncbi:helix-turn-helix domain-containing protein [Balneola sp. MJW-20]|uniref:helix-turn-helix domain-containing protein n=1 Tax=Gracilimonas aurantiaca TaxID=3234185 RepID=UPI003467E09E